MRLTRKSAVDNKERVYQFIKRYLSANEESPLLTEIQQALGFRSTSSIARHVDELVAEGRIIKESKWRGLRLNDDSTSRT